MLRCCVTVRGTVEGEAVGCPKARLLLLYLSLTTQLLDAVRASQTLDCHRGQSRQSQDALSWWSQHASMIQCVSVPA
eukprot:9484496-Pyramimonas_sp.AAC.2